MTPKEYMTLFDTLIAWGHDEDTARHFIHDWIETMALENDEDE